LAGVIEEITCIPSPFIRGVPLDNASVAQRLSWAANRATKKEEDTAYCLLGIFGVSMPMMYGERDQAFRRLQQEIMKQTGDHSILAWHLNRDGSIPSQSTDVRSGGALATAPSYFVNCGDIVSTKKDKNTFHISAGYLQARLPLYKTSAGDMYGLLSCGPEANAEQVVGIPLTSSSDEYIRPQGHRSVLLPKTTSNISPTLVSIQLERTSAEVNQQNWFYVEDSVEDLELIDVYPGDRWQKEIGMIATANDSDGNITQWSLARFSTKGEKSQDIIVLLEFEVHGGQPQARHHVMTTSGNTPLENLYQKLIYMREGAFGKQGASAGGRNVVVTVRKNLVAGQPMFVVKLAPMRNPPEVTIDATFELCHVDSKLEYVSILREQDKMRPDAERLDQQRDKREATLESMRERLAVVEENLRKFGEEKRLLDDRLEKGDQELDELAMEQNEVRKQRDKLSERESEIQRSLDELQQNEAPDAWFEAIIKKQLHAGKIDVDLKDTGDCDSDPTPLLRAAESRNNICSQTPLSWAAANGHQAVLEKLLEQGADCESKDNEDRTPLAFAAQNGHEAVVKLLVENGADRESKTKDGWTPLACAASNGHEAVVKLLLERGADHESKTKDGLTPLTCAASNGHEAVVKLLLEQGADRESKKNSCGIPLAFAAQSGHEAVVKLLLEQGADHESKDSDGWTPLAFAAQNGHEAVVKLLLEQGADREWKDSDGWTPLALAALDGHEAVVKLLLEQGADRESKNNNGRIPLAVAAQNGHEAVAKLLLEQGADGESKDNNGWTPLALAALNGHEAVVKLLFEHDAGREWKTKDGWTPLTCAASNGHKAVVKLLLEHGADHESKTKDGWTPLAYAASNGHEAVVKLLLERGAGRESKNNSCGILLAFAAQNGHEGVVKLLLEQGADGESKDNNGLTLACAASNGHEAVVNGLAAPQDEETSLTCHKSIQTIPHSSIRPSPADGCKSGNGKVPPNSTPETYVSPSAPSAGYGTVPESAGGYGSPIQAYGGGWYYPSVQSYGTYQTMPYSSTSQSPPTRYNSTSHGDSVVSSGDAGYPVPYEATKLASGTERHTVSYGDEKQSSYSGYAASAYTFTTYNPTTSRDGIVADEYVAPVKDYQLPERARLAKALSDTTTYYPTTSEQEDVYRSESPGVEHPRAAKAKIFRQGGQRRQKDKIPGRYSSQQMPIDK
jgi:ankyrin repeat protein